MHEFSTVDGFVEIAECLEEMIRYLANEPSVGLFYVQQHIQNAVPNLISLKDNVTEKSHEMSLQTEDLKDSITMVSSMKECGFAITDDMIDDIKKSLAIISRTQPKRGLIRNPSLGFQMGRSSSWSTTMWGNNVDLQQDTGRTSNYFSTVLQSAKQTASNFKWPHRDYRETPTTSDEKLPAHPNLSVSAATTSSTSNIIFTDRDELPISSPVSDELLGLQLDGNSSHHRSISLSENYDEYRAGKEAKLEEWLEQCQSESLRETNPSSWRLD